MDYRTNHRIKATKVFLIDENGIKVGEVDKFTALRKAKELNLDLVEINWKANPPICKILDYGKFKYDEKQKRKETKKKQHVVNLKEIFLTSLTEENDLNVKLTQAKKFIEDGCKVKFCLKFIGRQIKSPDLGRQRVQFFLDNLKEFTIIEHSISMESKFMYATIRPK
jgi:translation initiation factor IF-3